MPARIRQADDVSIVDWGAELSIIGEIRSLVEGGSARRVLLNMAACDGMRADDLETLTEAFTVCEDRGCKIGMFGVSDAMARLVEVMDLAGDLPPVLGKGEVEALAALRGAPQAVAAAAGNGKQPPASQQPIIDFDLDAAHAPTARFDPQQVAAASASAPAPAATGQQTDDDLLAIDWTPLVAAGYQLGGEGADRLTASLGPLPPAPVAAPRPAEVPTRAARRPQVEDDVIDLGDVAPAKVPVRDRGAFKTDVLPAFELEQSDARDRQPTRVLGGPGGDEDFSPVDTGQGGPPAFLRQQGHPTPTQPTPAVHTHPTPAQPTPAVGGGRPSADRKSERLGRGPVAPATAASAAPAPASSGAPVNPYYEAASLMESDDQTVMIQPGMIDAAMLASVAMAEAAPAPAAPVAPADDDSGEDDETVMFQPSALDAALLAEVAAVAGPDTAVAPPRVEEPPPAAPPPGLPPAAVAAVVAATSAGDEPPPDGRDIELRLFLHDHALSSTLHLQVLEKLVKSSDATFGKTDLQLATGSPVGAVSTVLDQLVQSRLVRRTRSPRVRGGTGFILSASPQARNTLVRLLKTWQAPTSRAKVAGWLDGAA